jgi:hypothetical protein
MFIPKIIPNTNKQNADLLIVKTGGAYSQGGRIYTANSAAADAPLLKVAPVRLSENTESYVSIYKSMYP